MNETATCRNCGNPKKSHLKSGRLKIWYCQGAKGTWNPVVEPAVASEVNDAIRQDGPTVIPMADDHLLAGDVDGAGPMSLASEGAQEEPVCGAKDYYSPRVCKLPRGHQSLHVDEEMNWHEPAALPEQRNWMLMHPEGLKVLRQWDSAQPATPPEPPQIPEDLRLWREQLSRDEDGMSLEQQEALLDRCIYVESALSAAQKRIAELEARNG